MLKFWRVQEIEIKEDLNHDYLADEIIQDDMHKVKINWMKIGLVFLVWDIVTIIYLIKR